MLFSLSFLQCGGTSAVRGFIDHITGPGRETELFIMGTDCSVVFEPIASLAPSWNLVQVIRIKNNFIIMNCPIVFH